MGETTTDERPMAPPVPPCPDWCTRPHDDARDRSSGGRMHCHADIVDLPGHPDVSVMVRVVTFDTWSDERAGWVRDRRPYIVITPAQQGAREMVIWRTSELKTFMAHAPFLVPGLLKVVLAAAKVCGIRVPQVTP